MYNPNHGVIASRSATAFAYTRCICGHPCNPGKTPRLIVFSRSNVRPSDIVHMPLRVYISAPRGPRNVLCVVVVTISKVSKGPAITPQAISPAICAISAINTGLYPCTDCTSSAICAKRCHPIVPTNALYHATIIAGLHSNAFVRISS